LLVAPVGKDATYVLGAVYSFRDLLDSADTERPEFSNCSCSRVFVRDATADELAVHAVGPVRENRDSASHSAVNKISGF
jgi:hypothetical protein